MGRHRRRQVGGSKVSRWLGRAAKSVSGFLRDTGLLSKGAAMLAPRLGPVAGGIVGNLGSAAGALGMGRRRYRGGALRLSGGRGPRRIRMY